jgi:hypothetical protein
MPIVKALMDNLVKQHGEAEGKRIYYAMESAGTGPFAKGAKHRDLHEAFAAKHGLPANDGRAKKKPAGPKPRRARTVRKR